MFEIKEINKVNDSGIISGDYSSSTNENFIMVRFVDDEYDYNYNQKVKVDIPFEDIDFANIESISDSMITDAKNKASVNYVQYLIDMEFITGQFGFSQKIFNPEEFEEHDIKNNDVTSFYDIINMMSPTEGYEFAKKIISSKL